MFLGFVDKNSFQTKTAEETAFGLNGLSSDRCCIEIFVQEQRGQHVRKSQQRHRTCLCVCVCVWSKELSFPKGIVHSVICLWACL